MKLAIQTTRDDHRIAWLAALAITIHIAESALPSPIPGAKPGLANIITIVCLMHYGWRTAAWVSLLRVLVGSLLIGTFLSPTFILSLSGAVASITVLGLASRLPGIEFGAIGYSLLAAMAHMAAQFFTAWLLFIPHEGLLRLLPVLMTMAIFFGATSGIIAHQVIVRIKSGR
ncbi:MAG: Gx transporter family protein [Pseudomonadota bacterium]|nr:Gx transporter family protein [Pseudomonadota bacterium]